MLYRSRAPRSRPLGGALELWEESPAFPHMRARLGADAPGRRRGGTACSLARHHGRWLLAGILGPESSRPSMACRSRTWAAFSERSLHYPPSSIATGLNIASGATAVSLVAARWVADRWSPLGAFRICWPTCSRPRCASPASRSREPARRDVQRARPAACELADALDGLAGRARRDRRRFGDAGTGGHVLAAAAERTARGETAPQPSSNGHRFERDIPDRSINSGAYPTGERRCHASPCNPACVRNASSRWPWPPARAQLFIPGDLVVSSSTYTGTASTVIVGQNLPSGAIATANGSYPNVFTNAAADPSFGVTSPLFLNQYKIGGNAGRPDRNGSGHADQPDLARRYRHELPVQVRRRAEPFAGRSQSYAGRLSQHAQSARRFQLEHARHRRARQLHRQCNAAHGGEPELRRRHCRPADQCL